MIYVGMVANVGLFPNWLLDLCDYKTTHAPRRHRVRICTFDVNIVTNQCMTHDGQTSINYVQNALKTIATADEHHGTDM